MRTLFFGLLAAGSALAFAPSAWTVAPPGPPARAVASRARARRGTIARSAGSNAPPEPDECSVEPIAPRAGREEHDARAAACAALLESGASSALATAAVYVVALGTLAWLVAAVSRRARRKHLARCLQAERQHPL